MMMPGNTRIGAALHAEHQDTMTALDRIEDLIGRSAPPMPTEDGTRRGLEAIAQVMDNDARRHFAFEEEHIFPVLRDAGADDMVDILVSEHDMIRPLAGRLCELSREVIASGAFAAPAWQEFREIGREIIDRQTFHVQKEEMGLLAAISQVLDEERDMELSLMFADARA